MNDRTLPHQERMMTAIAAWMKSELEDDARRERAGASMMATIYGLPLSETKTQPTPTRTPEREGESHVIQSYLALSTISDAVAQCEFYFRRYPFRGLPVTRQEHLRNSCEMYFDRLYQFKERLKLLINAIKSATGTVSPRLTSLIRLFAKVFDRELRHRNATHHNARYDYDAIDRLGLIDLLARGGDLPLPRAESIYRAEARKWVSIVHDRAKLLSAFVEEVARLTLEQCEFLRHEGPPSAGENPH